MNGFACVYTYYTARAVEATFNCHRSVIKIIKRTCRGVILVFKQNIIYTAYNRARTVRGNFYSSFLDARRHINIYTYAQLCSVRIVTI